jgi:tetrahydromethanopterin S-methyltransferase subunit G
MPLTNTLQNARKLEALGMPAEQARGVSEVVEEAVAAVQLDLKDFIRSELEKHTARIDAKIEAMRAEMHKAIQEQTQRYIFILIGLLSLAVTVIKLFPNLQ